MEKFLVTQIIFLLEDLNLEKLLLILFFLLVFSLLRYRYRIKLVDMAAKTPMKISDGKKFKVDSVQTIDEDIKKPIGK